MTQSAPAGSGKRLKFYLNLLALLLISVCGLTGLYFLGDKVKIAASDGLAVIMTGTLGSWRWSWFALHIIRSALYRLWVFPRWRRRANAIPLENLPTACLIAPTFKEKLWITDKVFRAIAHNAKSLVNPTIVVVVTTPEEIVAIREILQSEDPESQYIQYLPIADPGGGKRKALAVGLREVARLNLSKDTIIGLMDGDAVINPGVLSKCLPFFEMFPKIGGLTTDERATVLGSRFFEEWLFLRFAQRHLYMCSHAMSRKVLCLTGRFSLFRSEAALDPTFADLLESDTLNDWLWGQFKFLSGDDKSTWYWVLKRGYELLYVPDAMVDTIETISGSVTERAYQNMRRWFGNMLRNGSRAIALGPNKVGWFIWYCIIDQRLSIWTSLIAPGLLIIYLFQQNWVNLGLIVFWLAFTRSLTLIVFSIGRGEDYLRPIHLLYMLGSQWSSSVIKIWTQMNLAQQKWSNRGNQSSSAAGTGLGKWLKLGTSRFLYAAQLFTFAIALCSLSKVFSPPEDLAGLWWHSHAIAQPAPTQVIQASDRGILPDDGKDDSAILQTLLDRLPDKGLVQINLPIGEIDLFRPLEIRRSNTILKGQGTRRTILQVHLTQEVEEALLSIKPKNDEIAAKTSTFPASDDRVKNVQLNGFTLRSMGGQKEPIPGVNSILLERAVRVSVKNLYLEQSSGYALVLNDTQDVTVEYVAIDGDRSERDEIAMTNALNTKITGLIRQNSAFDKS